MARDPAAASRVAAFVRATTGAAFAGVITGALDLVTQLQRAQAAVTAHDVAGCKAAIATIATPADDQLVLAVQIQRAQCLMLAGQCDEGTALAQDVYVKMGMASSAEQNAIVLAAGYCPITGTLGVRLRRLQQQALLHIDHPAWCATLVEPARQVASEARADSEKGVLGYALRYIARCRSFSGACDDARELSALAVRLGQQPAELAPACRSVQ
jgi:hypothetical protein